MPRLAFVGQRKKNGLRLGGGTNGGLLEQAWPDVVDMPSDRSSSLLSLRIVSYWYLNGGVWGINIRKAVRRHFNFEILSSENHNFTINS